MYIIAKEECFFLFKAEKQDHWLNHYLTRRRKVFILMFCLWDEFFSFTYICSSVFSHIKTTGVCVTIVSRLVRSSLWIIKVLSSPCPHVCAAQDSIMLYFYARLPNILPRAVSRVPFHPRTRGWVSVSTPRGSNREEKCRQRPSLTANIKTRRTQWTWTKTWALWRWAEGLLSPPPAPTRPGPAAPCLTTCGRTC